MKFSVTKVVCLKSLSFFLLKKIKRQRYWKISEWANEQMRKWANEQKTSLKFVKFILFSFFCREKLLEYKKHVIRKEEATFQTQREKINKWV